MKSCSSRCSSAISPIGHRAATSAGSDPGDRGLWPDFQDQAPAEPPKLYLSLPVSTDKKGRETLELNRDCALPESRRERKRTDKRFAMLAAALGKSISGPPENLLCPRDRRVLQPVPTEAPGPITAKPVCPVRSFWPLEE